MGGTCHRSLYQLLADRTFCPTPYPSLTRSLPSLPNAGAITSSARAGTSTSIFREANNRGETS